MNNESRLESIIQSAYGRLTARERQLADLILENPNQILIFSASELAAKAQVSNSTVTRMVQQIGFDSYTQIRKHLRAAIGPGSPLSLLSEEEAAPAPPTGSLVERFADQEVTMLRAAFANLHPRELDEITTSLCLAGNLGFLGLRNSHFFAAYARWQFIQFRPRTRQMPGAGETIAERIADLGPGDAVMVVAVRRLVKKLERYIKAIAKTGADVLLITDPTGETLAEHARWKIICPVENPNIFDSYAGVLAVIRLLAYESFIKSGRKGREYMLAIEQQHNILSEFD